jgi:hypothetical protein
MLKKKKKIPVSTYVLDPIPICSTWIFFHLEWTGNLSLTLFFDLPLF